MATRSDIPSDREHFLKAAKFDTPGELALFGSLNASLWVETARRWLGEGFPEHLRPTLVLAAVGLGSADLDSYFKFRTLHKVGEIGCTFGWVKEFTSGELSLDLIHAAPPEDLLGLLGGGSENSVPVWPRFDETVLAEDERSITTLDPIGRTRKSVKGSSAMPCFLDYPVKDRHDWEEYKKRLDPHSPERWPPDWAGFAKKINSSDIPSMIMIPGFFGLPREWMGLEELLFAFHDEPAWVEEMMDHILEFDLVMMERLLADVRIEAVQIWEDMCYRAGPLISPETFRKFLLPRYQKLTEMLRSRGVEVICVDSDGNVDDLAPLWIEGGVNALWPLEIAAGCDPVAMRKRFGRDLILMGGIDKRAIAEGGQAIEREVMSKVPFLLESGGYLPGPDHNVPPDVSFANYCVYVDAMRTAAGLDKLFS
ncbi:MAG: uroporphyrinogen decarboxylase family protein [Actinomycetota bacterium]